MIDYLKTSPSLSTALEDRFAEADVNGDGRLSVAELVMYVSSIGAPLSAHDLAAIKLGADANSDGSISLVEFTETIKSLLSPESNSTDDHGPSLQGRKQRNAAFARAGAR